MHSNTELEKELFKAAKENQIKKVIELVREKGVDVNSRDGSK